MRRELTAISTPEGVHLILDDSAFSKQVWNDRTFRTVMSLGPNFALAGRQPSSTLIDDQISIFQYRIVKRIEAAIKSPKAAHRDITEQPKRQLSKYARAPMEPLLCRAAVDRFMSNGTWRERFPDIEDNLSKMKGNINRAVFGHKPRPNLSKGEANCVRKLSRSGKVLLINSDKSMGPVAISKNLFIEECFAHLSDKAGTYELLGQGIEDKKRVCELLKKEVQHLLTTIQSTQEGTHIARACSKRVTTAANAMKLATCYIIPKLHKTPISSRLIVPAFDTVIAPLADYLHETLFDEVAKHRYILRDTNHLIKRLEIANLNGKSAIQNIVTADVTALYPSIKLVHGLEALKIFMRKLLWPEQKISTILKVAEFVLTHNIIEFPLCEDHPIFRQVIGTAMGISFSVCYAIIFMIWFEDPLIKEAVEKGYMTWSDYWRFIDDLIFLWSGPRHALAEIMEKMNNRLPDITLTWSATPDEVRQGVFPQQTEFMDLAIWKEDDRWKFKIARKATAAFCYLHPRSCHPEANYKGFIKAEVLRILTHSSSVELARTEIAFFQRNLLKRGFQENELRGVCARIHWEERPQALWGQERSIKQESKDRIFCTVPFSPCTARIGRELRIHAQQEASSEVPQRGTASFCIRSSLGAVIRGR